MNFLVVPAERKADAFTTKNPYEALFFAQFSAWYFVVETISNSRVY